MEAGSSVNVWSGVAQGGEGALSTVPSVPSGPGPDCYRCFYKLQPQLTRSIYDQFVSQLQASIKEEIQEVKNEGNLEGLFSLLDKIVEEAKDREEPAWRPSGVPARDVRSALVPFLLQHRAHLRRALQERQERSSSLAEAVLAGRDSIAELQQLIQAHQQAWQVKRTRPDQPKPDQPNPNQTR
uniref:Polyamine modulated factor 1 n=1 Tax=Serinus canaria TaxID=9135 RepID=A0A8C9UG18_SERCA